jgi:hypothetical protein
MSATGGSISGGPYRIDVTPQAPTFYALPGPTAPDATPSSAPFSLVGDTSTAQIEVTQGWPHVRPAETPARVVTPA